VATLWGRAITLSGVVAWIGHEELLAMAALALPDGIHAPHHRTVPRHTTILPPFNRQLGLPGKEIHRLQQAIFG
jgi:hypothetical protein